MSNTLRHPRAILTSKKRLSTRCCGNTLPSSVACADPTKVRVRATHRHEPALELKEPTSIEIFLIRAVRYLLPRFFPPIVQDQIRISDTCLQSESISYFCLLMNTSKTTATTIFGSKNISDSKGLVWASPYSRCGPLTCHKVRLICEEPRF